MKFYTNVSIQRGKIIHSGYDNGKKFTYTEGFSPSLAIECNEDTGYKTLFEQNAKLIKFNSISEFNKYKKNYGDSLDLHNNISPIYQYISENYSDEINFNVKDIRVFMYDIETIDETKTYKGFPKPIDAPVPIVSVSIKDLKAGIMWVLGTKDFDENRKANKIDCKKIIYRKCGSEAHLLRRVIDIIQKSQPDMLVGYNNKIFDDPYLLHRISKILGPTELKRLSPVGEVNFEFRKNRLGKDECFYYIRGLQILDYIELYKKFIPGGRESYSLSSISSLELGDDKVDYSEHENITDFYIQDYQSFVEYNMYDVELIHLLDKKLQLLNLVFTIAYMAKINYEDIMSPIRTWDCMFYNYLKTQDIVIPPDKFQQRVSYPGAYVHDPIPGIYDWVVSYDLNSLYPMLICQYNISPDTLVSPVSLKNDIIKIDKEIEKLEGLLSG